MLKRSIHYFYFFELSDNQSPRVIYILFLFYLAFMKMNVISRILLPKSRNWIIFISRDLFNVNINQDVHFVYTSLFSTYSTYPKDENCEEIATIIYLDFEKSSSLQNETIIAKTDFFRINKDYDRVFD